MVHGKIDQKQNNLSKLCKGLSSNILVYLFMLVLSVDIRCSSVVLCDGMVTSSGRQSPVSVVYNTPDQYWEHHLSPSPSSHHLNTSTRSQTHQDKNKYLSPCFSLGEIRDDVLLLAPNPLTGERQN